MQAWTQAAISCNSVINNRSSYIKSQQAFCSFITGTLAMQAVLKGVGVGDSSASPVAATVTWLLKGKVHFIG